jgi:hypothetical protein
MVGGGDPQNKAWIRAFELILKLILSLQGFLHVIDRHE